MLTKWRFRDEKGKIGKEILDVSTTTPQQMNRKYRITKAGREDTFFLVDCTANKIMILT